MKKHLVSGLLKTVFLSGAVFAVFTFTACENFLRGQNVKQDLDKAIAYANAKSCSVYIKSDSNMGSFLSSGEKECRVGFPFELVFTVNKEYYSFNSLKAVSVNDQTKSRSDYVQFTLNEAESDIEKGVYRVNATLLKEANDILIVPDCTSYLRVESYSPLFTDLNSVAVPIVIQFSIPVNPETIENNISIMINNDDKMEALFETPILDEDNTIMTIFPKSVALKRYIKNNGFSFVEAKVILSNKIISQSKFGAFPLIQDNNSTFTVRYDATSEEIPPEEKKFFITRHPITLSTAKDIEDTEKFNYGNLAAPPKDFVVDDDYMDYTSKVRQNRTKGTIYIYGEYSDSGSGVQTVIVEDKLTNTFFSNPVRRNKRQIRYTKDSPNAVFKTVNDTTYFCIEHSMDTEDGAVRLSVSVRDAAGNSAETKTTTAFKKSYAVIGSEGHNFGTHAQIEDLMEYLSSGDIDNYKTALKNIRDYIYIIDTFTEPDICVLYWYDGTVQNDSEQCSEIVPVFIKPVQEICKYKNSAGGLEILELCNEYDTFGEESYLDEIYTATLKNVDSVSGLVLDITIYDDLGNSAQKTIKMPDPDEIKLDISKINNNKANVGFFHIHNESINNVIQIKYNENGQFLGFESPNSYGLTTIQSGYKYKMVAQDGYEGFWTEMQNVYYDINSQTAIFDERPVLSGEIEVKKSKNTFFYGGEIYACHDIIIPLSEEFISKFDEIEIYYSFQNNHGGNYHDDILFSENRLKPVLTLPTTWFYERPNNSIAIYGINSSGKTKPLIESLPHFIDEGTDIDKDHDNIPPVVTLDFSFEKEELYLSATDDKYSGINHFDYGVDSSKKTTVLPDSNGKVKLTFSLADLLEDDKYEYRFSYAAYDDATESNCNSGDLSFYFNDFPKGNFVSIEGTGTGTGRYIRTDYFTTPLKYTKDNVKLYYWDSGWKKLASFDFSGDLYSSDKKGYYNKIYFSSAPNKFIKVITVQDDNYSTPAYFYFGSSIGTGSIDKLLTTGFTDSVAIQSDAPVFVHTLVTNKPYSDCKNWSIKQWENYKKHLNDTQLTFSTSNTELKNYSIPVNLIGKGECYVVTAHFANGRTAISPIMTKD